MSNKKKPVKRARTGSTSSRGGTSRGSSSARGGKKKATKKTASRKTSSKSSERTTKKTAAKATRGSGKTATQSAPKKRGTAGAPSLSAPPKRKKTAKAATPSEAELSPEEAIADETPTEDAAPSSDPYPVTYDAGMLGIGSPLFPPNVDLDLDDEEEDAPETDDSTFSFGGTSSDDVETRIREIEDRLDGLMASRPHDDLDVDDSPEPAAIAPGADDQAVDAAREVLESDYYRKKWGRAALREHSFEVDDFGLDPDFEEKVRPALDFLFKKYFRVEVEGIRNIPSEGRGVVVANHSGALPFDGVMLREAIKNRHPGRDDLRWLAEDFSFYLPFLGVTMNRLGAVRACPENAERLLSRDHLVGVFPEGAEGIKKLFKNRYRLQRFGRGGFVRLALRTKSPIIPCAIVGAEETNPILYRFDNLSKLLGLDYLPITPTFPLLGPLGLLPAPTKWKIVFGEPISIEEYGPQAAQDHVLVGRIAERVRTSIGGLLETSLRRRKSVFL